MIFMNEIEFCCNFVELLFCFQKTTFNDIQSTNIDGIEKKVFENLCRKYCVTGNIHILIEFFLLLLLENIFFAFFLRFHWYHRSFYFIFHCFVSSTSLTCVFHLFSFDRIWFASLSYFRSSNPQQQKQQQQNMEKNERNTHIPTFFIFLSRMLPMHINVSSAIDLFKEKKIEKRKQNQTKPTWRRRHDYFVQVRYKRKK